MCALPRTHECFSCLRMATSDFNSSSTSCDIAIIFARALSMILMATFVPVERRVPNLTVAKAPLHPATTRKHQQAAWMHHGSRSVSPVPHLPSFSKMS